MRLIRQEREEIARRVVTYHISKITVCHFVKQRIPRQMIHDILKRYDGRKTTNFLRKSGRPSRLSNKDVQALVKSVNNKTGISQRRLVRRFGVHQSIFSRTLKNITTVKIYTRKSTLKYRNVNQKKVCPIQLSEALQNFETSHPTDFRRQKIFFTKGRYIL